MPPHPGVASLRCPVPSQPVSCQLLPASAASQLRPAAPLGRPRLRPPAREPSGLSVRGRRRAGCAKTVTPGRRFPPARLWPPLHGVPASPRVDLFGLRRALPPQLARPRPSLSAPSAPGERRRPFGLLRWAFPGLGLCLPWGRRPEGPAVRGPLPHGLPRRRWLPSPGKSGPGHIPSYEKNISSSNFLPPPTTKIHILKTICSVPSIAVYFLYCTNALCS